MRVGDAYAIRTKRDHVGQVRSMLLPETAYVEAAQFSEHDNLYILSHVPQITRNDLDEALAQTGWKAKAIKPQGAHRWIIASQQQPQAAHIAINGYIAIVASIDTKPAKSTVAMVAREIKINTTVDPDTKMVSTTSRIAEVRTQIETQVEQVMENKLQQANSRIAALTDALQEMQTKADQIQEKVAGDMTQIRDEQLFARQKLKEVEGSVAASGAAIIQQMQAMFTTMQSSLEQTMDRKFNESEKRHKTGENSKIDVFATKS